MLLQWIGKIHHLYNVVDDTEWHKDNEEDGRADTDDDDRAHVGQHCLYPGTDSGWDHHVNHVNVLREAVRDAAEWRRVKEVQWRMEDVTQHVDMKVARSTHAAVCERDARQQDEDTWEEKKWISDSVRNCPSIDNIHNTYDTYWLRIKLQLQFVFVTSLQYFCDVIAICL